MDNLLRQIADLKSQAEKINIDNAESRVKTFSKFNYELKSYLQANIEDEEILKLVKEIPNLEQEIQVDKSLTSFLVGTFFEGNSSFLETPEKSEETLNKIREIKGKYSSIEMLLKNSGKY